MFVPSPPRQVRQISIEVEDEPVVIRHFFFEVEEEPEDPQLTSTIEVIRDYVL